jgi:hypothetical protein
MFARSVSYSHVHSSVTIRTGVGTENYYGHKFIMKLCTGYTVLSQIIKYCTLTTNLFDICEYQYLKHTIRPHVLPASHLFFYSYIYILYKSKQTYVEVFTTIYSHHVMN